MIFEDWMTARRRRIEQALEACLPPENVHPVRLHQAMRYSVLGPGKRMRPLLVFATGETLGAPTAALDCVGCAVEIMHAYSLVHDDLPAIDGDVLRRGRPTTHVVYGEAMAILVGDALQSLAFEVLSGIVEHGVSLASFVEMVRVLAEAVGGRGMSGGQAVDILSAGNRLPLLDLQDMHARKTGALLGACVQLAALCAEVDDCDDGPRIRASLGDYASSIGLAFQVVDDVLDCSGETAVLGKTAGKDAKQSKPTYPAIIGLDAAVCLAEQLRTKAHEAVAHLKGASRLMELADYVVQRRA